MITLQELFDTLAQGELANLSLGNSPLRTITEAHYPKMVSHINLGLIELYKRFHLREGEVRVHQYPGVTTYYLRSAHSGELADMCEDTYLEVDDANPFLDDVLKVTQVYNSLGDELPLNNSTNPLSVFTPSFDVLKTPVNDPPDVLSVVYRASYPKIVITPTFNPITTKLHIPDYIIEPLLLYVASRAFKATPTPEGEVNPNTSNIHQYELACRKVEMYSLPPDVNDTRNQFTAKGWV